MSYCRFSTDDFRCDLYCYVSGGGYVTMVAHSRHVFAEPLPRRVSMDSTARYLARDEKVMKMVENAKLVPIGLKYDGQSFVDQNLEDFLVTLRMLKKAGYRFPKYLIPSVKREIADGNHDSFTVDKENNPDCPAGE